MITETYKGVAITYSERGNNWLFKLGDFERQAASLALAKKAIDAKPKFKRIPVWTTGRYNSEQPERAELTSVDADGRQGWVVYPSKERSQVYTNNIWPRNEVNDKAAEKWLALIAEKDRIEDEISAVRASMLRLPKQEQEAE